MTLLITGGAGFIGSAVVRLAIARGQRVVNVDALTYAANLDALEGASESARYAFEHVDIRDGAAIQRVLDQHQPDGIIHLAAESHVDRSIDGPADFIQINLVGTFNLLEAARIYWQVCGKPDSFRFQHISTDEVFGSLSFKPSARFNEDTPYNPRSPYSASKASSDHLARSWHRTFDFPVIITNCSNNYGPYQFPEKLLPLFINNIINNRPLPVYGDGNYTRDWLYVQDHVRAIDLIFHRGSIGETYNIGGFNEWKNMDLIKLLCSLMNKKLGLPNGSSEKLIKFVKDRPGHDKRYAIDASKLNKDLGWYPSVNFEEGLSKTVDWFLSNKNWLNQK